MPFQKGHDPNRNIKGRGKGVIVKEFERALEEDAKKHGQSLIEFAVNKARTDNDILKAVINKLLPDLSKSEVETILRGGIQIIRPDGNQVVIGEIPSE